MTPKELKSSILQLAIQGKLVEQRPEEGTAEELYKQIQEEKQRLIAEKKIKKETPLPEITEDEKPFDIPDNWKWVRIGEIFQTYSGTTPLRTNAEYYTTNDYNWVRTTDLNNSILKSCEIKISEKAFKDCRLEIIPRQSVCVAMYGGAGTIGKNALIGFDTTINQSVCAIKPNKFCNMKYVQIYIQFYRSYWMKAASGSRKDPNINQIIIKNAVFPLLPFAEQKRIVEKLEQILPHIEQYEKVWNKLEKLNKRFPDDMKKSLLQYAIQGKLVEQRPEEGTAEELYKQIQEEKQRLIAEKKIKKEKPLPEITEDEKPFDIPDNWKWMRLGEVCSIINGFTPLRSNDSFWNNTTISWFTVEDIRLQGRRIKQTTQSINKCALTSNDRLLPANTVLLCCTASVGEYAITEIPLVTNQQFNGLVIKDYFKNILYSEFLFSIAPTFKQNLLNMAGKTTFNFISVRKLSNLIISLPPLAEQKRIVEKLEQLLPLCERLK